MALAVNPPVAGLAAGPATTDRIESVALRLVFLPLATPVSDAKVLTGRQKPLTEVAMPTSERSRGTEGWASPTASAREARVSSPTRRKWRRPSSVRTRTTSRGCGTRWCGQARRLGAAAWRRRRFGRLVEPLQLIWIEEPLDAYDAEGHAALAAMLDTPIASGEMLTSVAEHVELIRHCSVDVLQPDAPRVGGITPMLKIMALADQARLRMAPHFSMELHVHLAAAYPHEPWVEHFGGSSRCSTSGWRSRAGECWCRTGLG